jgi:hypothetical protein
VSTITEYRINATGLASIARELRARHKAFATLAPTPQNLLAWAADAEQRLNAGDQYPQFEILSREAVSGHTEVVYLDRTTDFDQVQIEVEE